MLQRARVTNKIRWKSVGGFVRRKTERKQFHIIDKWLIPQWIHLRLLQVQKEHLKTMSMQILTTFFWNRCPIHAKCVSPLFSVSLRLKCYIHSEITCQSNKTNLNKSNAIIIYFIIEFVLYSTMTFVIGMKSVSENNGSAIQMTIVELNQTKMLSINFH